MQRDYKYEDREALIIGYESGLGVQINPNHRAYNALLNLFDSIQNLVRELSKENR